MTRYISQTVRNIGSCSYCITRSFLFLAMSVLSLSLVWLAQLGGMISIGDLPIKALSAIVLCFLALWTAHITVFGFKSARFKAGAMTSASRADYTGYRRQMLVNAAKSALGIAAFSAANIMTMASSQAFTRCGGNGLICQNNQNCCIWGQGNETCCPKGWACAATPGTCEGDD